MQQVSLTRGVLDAVTEPLLPATHPSGLHHTSGGGHTGGSDAGLSAAASALVAVPRSDLHFVRRFKALVLLLRPYTALFLALLSVAEAVVVAEVGKVAGSFYRIVVDAQPAMLANAMLHAGLLYAASTAIYAATSWVTEALALQWRQRLTSHLHRQYCQHQHAYYFLQLPASQRRQQAGMWEQQEELGQQQHGEEGDEEEEGSRVDNADQRIASDAAELCECLAAVSRVAAAAPFKLLWLTHSYLGWRCVAAVYAFFWLAGLVQRLAVAPVARLVFRQERREGDLRFAHLRLREYASEVAQYRGTEAELRHLDSTLGTTRAVDYAGALLNYAVVGAAVFSGMAGDGGDSGQMAQFVSNASFATLTLIYTFTELLDLSDKLSKLGGLTARVGQLLEALPGSSAAAAGGDERRRGKLGGGTRHDLHAVRLSIDQSGRELQPSRFGTLLQPPRLISCLGGSVELEVSTHRLGPDLQHEAGAIFPDAPANGGQMLACLTFQFASGSISLAPDTSGATLQLATAEMDRLLDRFLRWEAAVRDALAAMGHWCGSVDPRSGTALHGTRGARWSEVAAAHALLGYERRDAGICPVVLHPTHGTSAYPVTLFTNAPPADLERALAAVSDTPPATLLLAGGSRSLSAALPLLSLQHLTVCNAAGVMVVSDLSLDLHAGQHLLIAGPNGCGKSTLVKALCRLHPLAAGQARVGGEGGAGGGSAMFLPQRPLAAPGTALWQQLCYPGSDAPGDSCLQQQQQQQQQQQERTEGQGPQELAPSDSYLLALLERVGLQYLLDRVGGSFQAAADWGAQLSPGELQRLAVARVLHRCPAVAVLDEPTSAVSEDAAAQLYGQLHAAGVTCISIGQDSLHLRRLHTHLLLLGCGPEAGTWQLQ
ncbi:ATP-binding cassette sub-family D member 4 [Chlorella vulgaris]